MIKATVLSQNLGLELFLTLFQLVQNTKVFLRGAVFMCFEFVGNSYDPTYHGFRMHCKMQLLWRVLMTFRVLKTNGITSSMRCSLWLKVVFLFNCLTKSVNDKLIYSWPTVFVFWPCYLCPVPLVSFAQNTVTMK